LKPLHRAPGLEALLLVVLVTVLSFAGFELVRRVPLLRPLFGLGPRQLAAATVATSAATAATTVATTTAVTEATAASAAGAEPA
jgi:glucan biosynthesis protein C